METHREHELAAPTAAEWFVWKVTFFAGAIGMVWAAVHIAAM